MFKHQPVALPCPDGLERNRRRGSPDEGRSRSEALLLDVGQPESRVVDLDDRVLTQVKNHPERALADDLKAFGIDLLDPLGDVHEFGEAGFAEDYEQQVGDVDDPHRRN